MPKATQYLYFVKTSCKLAYRAPYRQSKEQKVLNQFTITKPPQVYTPEGWSNSTRYSGPEAIESFQCGIDAGAFVRMSLLKACAEICGDVVLFAPTVSSRIASKKVS